MVGFLLDSEAATALPAPARQETLTPGPTPEEPDLSLGGDPESEAEVD